MGVKRSAPETTTGFADKEKNKLFGNKVWLKGYIGLGGEEWTPTRSEKLWD